MEQPTTDQINPDDNLTTVVSIVEQFEEAWQRGLTPEIEHYLPAAGSPHRQRTLVELIRIDLERRLQSNLDAQLKGYLQRYPHLAPTEMDCSLDLDWGSRDGSFETAAEPDSGPGPSIDEGTYLFPPQTQADHDPGGNIVAVPASDRMAGGRRRYTVVRLHAEGGIGQIWTAHDRDLDREVALKRLHPGGDVNTAARARFLREARVTGQLQHPGIVPVYELCQAGAGPELFYTMRLIKGRTLREAIQDYHQKRKN